MSKSVKVNFFFNLIQVVSSLLFPLITFPYVSRVIMADGIGQIQFFTSIINYIILFSSIGIPMYGIREIARVRDNKEDLQRTTIEILALNLILTFLGYIAVLVVCCIVEKIQVNVPLFVLLSSSILLTTIGCSWFYSGIEDFKYIAIRGFIIKCIAVVVLFATVHSQSDLLWYGFYTVAGSIGNNIINFYRLRRYFSFRDCFQLKLNIRKHLKPALSIFVFNLITSIYLNLDTLMLGFIKGNTAVGYYTAATKLSHLLLTVVTSIGTVLLPRSSNLIKNNKTEEFAKLSAKAYNFNLMLGFPVCFGLIILSPQLIRLFSGDSFVPAIITLQLISPIVIAIGISNLIGLQVLYPLGKINLVTISTCVGAIFNFILNCFFIPKLAQNGAAIATAVAEVSVVLTQFVIARKYIPFKPFNIFVFKYFLCAIIMAFACYYISSLFQNDFVSILLSAFVGFCVYSAALLLAKDKIAFEVVGTMKKFLSK